jgi:hypothetical protein
MDVSGFISTGHLLISEAYLRVLAKVAGGLSISGVQVATNKTPIPLPFAVLGVALKDMNTAPLDILNQRGGLEERVDW